MQIAHERFSARATITQAAQIQTWAAALCGQYMLEASLALIGGVSTMHQWSRSMFVGHHVVFGLVMGLPLTVMGPGVASDILKAYSDVLPVSMLAAWGEALLAARALGCPAWVEAVRHAFVVLVLHALLLLEVVALLHVFFDQPTSDALFLHAWPFLAVPLHQLCGVLPTELRGLTAMLASIGHSSRSGG
jgi:hypothetical protein